MHPTRVGERKGGLRGEARLAGGPGGASGRGPERRADGRGVATGLHRPRRPPDERTYVVVTRRPGPRGAPRAAGRAVRAASRRLGSAAASVAAPGSGAGSGPRDRSPATFPLWDAVVAMLDAGLRVGAVAALAWRRTRWGGRDPDAHPRCSTVAVVGWCRFARLRLAPRADSNSRHAITAPVSRFMTRAEREREKVGGATGCARSPRRSRRANSSSRCCRSSTRGGPSSPSCRRWSRSSWPSSAARLVARGAAWWTILPAAGTTWRTCSSPGSNWETTTRAAFGSGRLGAGATDQDGRGEHREPSKSES